MSFSGGDIKTRGNCDQENVKGANVATKKGGYIQLDSIMEVFSMVCWQLLFPSASDRWFPYMGGESIAK